MPNMKDCKNITYLSLFLICIFHMITSKNWRAHISGTPSILGIRIEIDKEKDCFILGRIWKEGDRGLVF